MQEAHPASTSKSSSEEGGDQVSSLPKHGRARRPRAQQRDSAHSAAKRPQPRTTACRSLPATCWPEEVTEPSSAKTTPAALTQEATEHEQLGELSEKLTELSASEQEAPAAFPLGAVPVDGDTLYMLGPELATEHLHGVIPGERPMPFVLIQARE